MELSWWFPTIGSDELMALVDLSAQRVWLFSYDEAVELAQQKPASRSDVHFYMHLERVETRSGHARTHIDHFQDFRLDLRLGLIHGSF